ncbi:MAG: N-acetylmuramic acid 6-phosphate etherase [Planctomycetota bacterium]|jgi:N-acetylmuramic acid 6-phosphate etherase|nr:N-acetylmuramic acid 6-phosphate etherase [Planctomycetota bacterium]
MKTLPTTLATEAVNPASARIDECDPLGLVRLINAEDAGVAAAVAAAERPIAHGIEIVATRLAAGGRLIYLGAGTSGRLGVLDAAECPPTFGVPPGLVIGLIAGGPTALTTAVEGAEDRPELAVADLTAVTVGSGDVVVGIATSGRTPYVLGGLAHARALGCPTIGLACTPEPELAAVADELIVVEVGPEIIAGSTRLKAGTATKMVLNMLTTGAMVRLGKTYGNLMVDLKATNSKLMIRSRRLVARLTGIDETRAEQLLAEADGELKTAVVSHLKQVPPAVARQLLAEAGGHLRKALGPEHGDAARG